MTEERQIKIAVIGAAGPRYASPEVRVECFQWNRLKKLANLADYDIVILDLLFMTDQRLPDVEILESVLNERSMLEVLVSKNQSGPFGNIYVLGDPRFSITRELPDIPWVPAPPSLESAETSSGSSAHTGRQQEIPFLYWTNMEFVWDDRPGDTIERTWEASAGQFKRYVDRLGRWPYSLKACRLINYHLLDEFLPADVLRDPDYELKAHVDDVCRSRYSTSIVFSVRIVAESLTSHRRAGIGTAEQVMPLTGPIYFMPESQLTEEETLEFVLRDLIGVDVSAPEPEWVSQFVAPGQVEVDREIDELEARIGELRENYTRKVEEWSEIRELLKLLYETGPPLEEAVRSVMEALGAEVEWPGEDRNKEDGWVTVWVGDETFEGVLEVKGVKTEHFDTYGLRQLTTWIHRGISSRKKKYTGIFVGNSSRQDPPRRRIWPFSKDWVEEAELHGYAAIRSEDLYVLYLLDRTGRLNRDEFWRDLFSTKGPFDMRPYREMLTNEEKDQLGNIPQP